MSKELEELIPAARTRLTGIVATIGYACLTFSIYLSTLVDVGIINGLVALVMFYILHSTTRHAVSHINLLHATYAVEILELIESQSDGTNEGDESLSSVDGEDNEQDK